MSCYECKQYDDYFDLCLLPGGDDADPDEGCERYEEYEGEEDTHEQA